MRGVERQEAALFQDRARISDGRSSDLTARGRRRGGGGAPLRASFCRSVCACIRATYEGSTTMRILYSPTPSDWLIVFHELPDRRIHFAELACSAEMGGGASAGAGRVAPAGYRVSQSLMLLRWAWTVRMISFCEQPRARISWACRSQGGGFCALIPPRPASERGQASNASGQTADARPSPPWSCSRSRGRGA